MNILAFIALGGKGYDKVARIAFLDVGQGDATLILAENDNQVLIDGGDGKKIMDKLGEYMPFYDHSIEMVVITHPDSDHIGGLVEVLKYYDVNEILQTQFSCDTQICRELDRVVSDKKISRRYAEFGQIIHVGGQKAEVLYLGAGSANVQDDNENSIILKAWINGRSILLMGDAGFKTEGELISKNINIDSDILKVSHHGSKSATSVEFIEEVSPQRTIISVGRNNKYGHPSEVVLNRLRNANIEVLRTDESGDVVIE